MANWTQLPLNKRNIERVAQEHNVTVEEVTEVLESVISAADSAMRNDYDFVMFLKLGKFVKKDSPVREATELQEGAIHPLTLPRD